MATGLLKSNANLRKSHDNIHHRIHDRVMGMIFKSSSTKSLAKKEPHDDTLIESLKSAELNMSFLQQPQPQQQQQQLLGQSLSQSKLMILAQDDGGIYKGPYM